MTTANERGSAQASTRSWWGRLDAVFVLAAFLGLAATLPAQAQTASGGDPPSRVARLSDVSGQVWIYDDEADEWLAVERNRPLTTGDRIATDSAARAEITLGSTTLRLDAGTEIEIARLDDSRYIVRLVNGSIAARLRSPQALAEFEIDTDVGQFRAQTVGRYRVDHRDQTSDLTVYNGQAAYGAKGTALPVYTGQHVQFWIDTAGLPQYAMVAPARDPFSAWNDDRDRGEDRVATQRFVSPEMTGAEDLARYGQWQQTPDDGPIWVPTSVPVGWAPYSAGHWAFVRPWGWTWVDDAPWGFAPFHYGRGVYRSNVWCWAPGTYVARPVYAPALVAWIGGPRAGLSLSIGGGGPPVGWFPLAPREVYVPSYRASSRYVREVNITHVTNITNITTIVNNRNGEADRRDFANRRLPHAVTFVPSDVITRRQPVGPAAERFRNDPQMRTFVADARPGSAVSAPPIAAPVVSPRPQAGRQPPRPPFEGRAPGGFAGRPDGAGNDPGRAPGARPDTSRPDAGRPDAGRPEVGRSEFRRPGERPVAQPAVTGPVAAPPPVVAPPTVVGAPPAVAPRNDSSGRGMPQPGVDRGRPGREGATAPIGTPAIREPSAPPPVAAVPAPVRPAPAVEAMPQQRVVPNPNPNPSAIPIPRGVPAGDGRVAPGLRGTRGAEGAAPDIRPAPQQQPPPPPTAGPGATEGAGRRPERMAPPRQVDRAHAAEVARPAPVAPQVATPAPVAPPAAAPRAPDARPAEAVRPGEATRPVISEPRMNRPEAPRPGRDDRRDDKAERPR